jgi:hypothetical protein
VGNSMPYMIAPDSTLTNVPEDKQLEAQGRGFIPAPKEVLERLYKGTREKILQQRYGDVGGMATSFGIGAASGATLGLSDIVVADTLGDSAELAKEANPISHTIGQLAGIVGSSLYGGAPVSLAAKAGETVAAKVGGTILRGLTDSTIKGAVAKKLIQGAVQGGVEGGIWGAGQGVSQAAIEESLGDPKRLAELVASNVAMNALGGAAFGSVGSVVGLGIGRATRTIAKRLPENAGGLGEAADMAALRAVGIAPGEVGGYIQQIERHGSEGQLGRVRDMLFKEGGLPDGTPILKSGNNKRCPSKCCMRE